MTTTTTPPAVRRLAASALLLGLVLNGVVLWYAGLEFTRPWVFVGLVVAHGVSDLRAFHIEIRDHSVASSATEFFLSLALFTVAPAEAILSRIIGGIPRRTLGTAVKNQVNTALMLLGVGVAVGTFEVLAADAPLTSPQAWGALVVAMAVAMAVDAWFLREVIRRATGDQVVIDREVITIMCAWSIVSSLAALSMLLLATIHPAAALLVGAPYLALGVLHRAHARQRGEVRRLQTLHELATGLSGAPQLESRLAEVVTEARELLRCDHALLVLHAHGADGNDLVVRADAAGGISAGHDGGIGQDEDWAVLDGGGREDVSDDRLVVAVASGGDALGALAVRGRPHGRAAFGPTDRAALGSLADQIGAELGRTRLSAQLRTTAEARDYLELHDPLTGLGNRRAFGVALEGFVSLHTPVVVALINVRGFRDVNESLGVAAGDLGLVAVADRLRQGLPDSAVVARLAGDEFAVVVPAGDALDVELVVGSDVTAQLRGTSVTMPLVAGVVHWPQDQVPRDGILRAADLALAAARRGTGGTLVHYARELEESVARRARLTTDLRQALDQRALDVHFQPLVDLRTGTTVAVEALARWTHPEFGPVGPDEFVPLAEEAGLVALLTRHVLLRACAAGRAWRDAGHDIEVAVNVSARDLEGTELVDDVRHALRTTGVPAELLVLEITETAMMQDRERVDVTLAALSRLGVGLAIDDFGTGHSSLAYLQDLPVTEIKVDRHFVSTLADLGHSELIVRTVVELAAQRRLVVVAEGVEDAATAALLLDLGVARGQGWHWGRAVPCDAVVVGGHGAQEPAPA